MKPLILILLLTGCVWSPVYAAQQIIFNITPRGLPPYMVKEEGQPDSGIMLDVLKVIAHKHGYSVKLAVIPRKRIIRQIDLGKVDTVAMAKEWVPNPQNYTFSDSIVQARDVLFSLKTNPTPIDNINALFGKKLSTHLGYHYPTLDTYFINNTIQRHDAPTEREMLGMVIFGRTEAAVLNELVGKWYIKNNPIWQHQFYISTQTVSEVGFRILFNKRWQHFVQLFNQELATMKQNGQLQRIISKYQ